MAIQRSLSEATAAPKATEEAPVTLDATIFCLPVEVITGSLSRTMNTATMSRLSKTCRFFSSSLASTLHHPATKIGHHLIRGEVAEVKALLEEAEKNNILKEVLTKKIKVTTRSGKIFHGATLLMLAWWSFDHQMWELIIAKLDKIDPDEVNKQLCEYLNTQNSPQFVKDHGLCFSFDEINRRYAAFNQHRAALAATWQGMTDYKLEMLWYSVIYAMNELPDNVIQQLSSPTVSLPFSAVNGITVTVYDDYVRTGFVRSRPGFGKTHGIVRDDTLVSLVDSQHAHEDAIYIDYLIDAFIPWMEINAAMIQAISAHRVTKLNALIAKRLENQAPRPSQR